MSMNFFEAALATAAALVVPLAAAGLATDMPRTAQAPTVAIGATTLDYPPAGEFLRDGVPVTAPVERIELPGFRIMIHQVRLADYQRCVDAGACNAADAAPTAADVPVTGVSWLDAQAYAQWLSVATGDNWRLPTAREAAAAAGERFGGDPLSLATDDPANPAARWLRRYREETEARRPADPAPKPRGHYGANALGLEDFGGNVWEWTSTCYSRTALDAGGAVAAVTENCGVHVLEGRHRAYMSNFVRDGKSGGCAVGTPPENLGFRLVRDDAATSMLAALAARFRTLWSR